MKIHPHRKRRQLGARSLDVVHLDEMCDADKKHFEKGGEELRERLEEECNIDRHKKMQGSVPAVDEALINFCIEQVWEFIDNDSSVVLQL